MELQEDVKTYCKRLYGLLGLHSENNPFYVDDALWFSNTLWSLQSSEKYKDTSMV